MFDLPNDAHGNTGIVVFVDRESKMANLSAVTDNTFSEGIYTLFVNRAFGQHGLPVEIGFDRYPLFTTDF